MSHENSVEILPSSVYETGKESTFRKLWKLFSDPLDDLENGIRYWYDKDSLEGDSLDRMGKLRGVPRNGMSDEEYRFALNPITQEIISLPAVYDAMSGFGTSPRVRELHSPYLFTMTRLDGTKTLDGSWNLDPAETPKIMKKLDGSWLLDGSEPLEPYGIRKLALLLSISTDASFQYSKMPAAVERLLAGITVYYQFNVSLELSSDLSGYSSENEAVFFNADTELFRVPAETSEGKLVFRTPKTSHTVTKLKILSSGILKETYSLSIQTSSFLQYYFTAG